MYPPALSSASQPLQKQYDEEDTETIQDDGPKSCLQLYFKGTIYFSFVCNQMKMINYILPGNLSNLYLPALSSSSWLLQKQDDEEDTETDLEPMDEETPKKS